MTVTGTPGPLPTILLAHEKAHARALKERNKKALEVLLAPEFIGITPSGRFSKKDVLSTLLPGLILQEFIISNPQLMGASPDSAILVYQCIADCTMDGQSMTGTFHVAAHYAKQEEKWVLLVWQITPVSC